MSFACTNETENSWNFSWFQWLFDFIPTWLGTADMMFSNIKKLAFNLLKRTGYMIHQQFNLLKPTGYMIHQQFNLLKPTGYVMHQHLTF